MIELGPGERLVVIASCSAEARRWAVGQGYLPRQVIPLVDSGQLRGLPWGIKYVLVGGWARRRDWPELDDTLRARQARQM